MEVVAWELDGCGEVVLVEAVVRGLEEFLEMVLSFSKIFNYILEFFYSVKILFIPQI